MAFLDKVKDIADKGLDKAKDLGETASAKAKIAVVEAKMKDVYEEIGKAVVEAGGQIPEGGIAELLDKFKGFQDEVDAIKAALAEAKADDEKAE